MHTTDEELVTQAAAGDAGAFDQLVGRWERPIYFLAYRMLGREEDARDATQEAFLRAFRGLKGFRGQSRFSSCVVPDRAEPLPGLVAAGASVRARSWSTIPS